MVDGKQESEIKMASPQALGNKVTNSGRLVSNTVGIAPKLVA
jgi:hypothetical protein